MSLTRHDVAIVCELPEGYDDQLSMKNMGEGIIIIAHPEKPALLIDLILNTTTVINS